MNIEEIKKAMISDVRKWDDNSYRYVCFLLGEVERLREFEAIVINDDELPDRVALAERSAHKSKQLERCVEVLRYYACRSNEDNYCNNPNPAEQLITEIGGGRT